MYLQEIQVHKGFCLRELINKINQVNLKNPKAKTFGFFVQLFSLFQTLIFNKMCNIFKNFNTKI